MRDPDDEIDAPERVERIDPVLWERRVADGESADDHALFLRWLAAPSAALPAFAATEQRPVAQIVAIAARNRWRPRRAAWLDYLAKEHVEGAADAARAMGRRHASVLGELLDWAAESITHARSQGKPLSPKDAIAAARLAIELQRLQAGQPTSRTAIDLSSATDEQIAALRGAVAAVTRPVTREN